MSEFDLINTYFNWQQPDNSVSVHNGDDAAVVQLANNEELVVSVDTSIKGVHFPEDTPPHAVGYKALAVNLSDMAAMGATPRWFTLALTLPNADADWLGEFSAGLRWLAERHKVTLIGGDTTRGPLSITIQIMGTVNKGMALKRSGAQEGDLICITGTPGDAAAGLAYMQSRLALSEPDQDYCCQRLNYPTPRVEFGQALSKYANSCIDVSDGLLADLQHILDQSAKSADVDESQLPLSPVLRALPLSTSAPFALTGGDDYELLFTVKPDNLTPLHTAAADTKTPITVIGKITQLADNTLSNLHKSTSATGFNHFSD